MGCDSAGVSLLENSKVSTATATDEFTLKIDIDQYENLEGPCLQAFSTHEVVKVDDISSDPRWPGFSEAAFRDSLGSVLRFRSPCVTNRWELSTSIPESQTLSTTRPSSLDLSSRAKQRWPSPMHRSTRRPFASRSSSKKQSLPRGIIGGDIGTRASGTQRGATPSSRSTIKSSSSLASQARFRRDSESGRRTPAATRSGIALLIAGFDFLVATTPTGNVMMG